MKESSHHFTNGQKQFREWSPLPKATEINKTVKRRFKVISRWLQLSRSFILLCRFMSLLRDPAPPTNSIGEGLSQFWHVNIEKHHLLAKQTQMGQGFHFRPLLPACFSMLDFSLPCCRRYFCWTKWRSSWASFTVISGREDYKKRAGVHEFHEKMGDFSAELI